MLRPTLGVIIGFAVWTAIWLAGNTLILSDVAESIKAGESYTEAGPLGMALGLSVICSLLSGVVCALIAKGGGRRAVLVLALLLLATGIIVQAGVLKQMPVWYHAAFLVLLVPAVFLGARMVKGRAATVG